MQFFDELPGNRVVRGKAIDWKAVKEDLMANPGQWGLMAENVSSSQPGQLNAGKNQSFRGEELAKFEYRVRRPENPETPYAPRRTDLYGRYNDA